MISNQFAVNFRKIFSICILLLPSNVFCSIKLEESKLCNTLVTTLDLCISNDTLSEKRKKYYSKVLHLVLFENFVVYDKTGVDNLCFSAHSYKVFFDEINKYINKDDPYGFINLYENDRLSELGNNVMHLSRLSDPNIFNNKSDYIQEVQRFNKWIEEKINN